MTEATVGDGAPAVNSLFDDGPLIPPIKLNSLRGLPRGLFCKSCWVREHMGWNWRTWKKWKDGGMPTVMPDTQEEHVLTDWVIDFLAERKTP